MSPSDNDRSRSQIPYFQPSHPPPLPPETYTYLIQALLSLRGSAYPPTSPYPWSPDAASPFSTTGPPSFRPLLPHAVPQSASSSQLIPSPVASPTATSSAQDPEGTEDATSTTEDKRRRNTAASARFRIKKKLRTLNLERTVGDLTGRTEELEREAHDLRRENAWLKEIVLLKSRHLTGSQTTAPASQHDETENDGLGHAGSSRTRGEGQG